MAKKAPLPPPTAPPGLQDSFRVRTIKNVDALKMVSVALTAAVDDDSIVTCSRSGVALSFNCDPSDAVASKSDDGTRIHKKFGVANGLDGNRETRLEAIKDTSLQCWNTHAATVSYWANLESFMVCSLLEA